MFIQISRWKRKTLDSMGWLTMAELELVMSVNNEGPLIDPKFYDRALFERVTAGMRFVLEATGKIPGFLSYFRLNETDESAVWMYICFNTAESVEARKTLMASDEGVAYNAARLELVELFNLDYYESEFLEIPDTTNPKTLTSEDLQKLIAT